MKKSIIISLILSICNLGFSQDLKVQTGHASFISGIDFTKDDHHLISGGIDGQIKLWESSTGREIKSIATGLPMYAMEYSKSQNAAVIADFFGNISIWDMKSGLKKPTSPIKYVSSGMPQMGIAAGIAGVHTQVYRPISVYDNYLAVANEGDAMANIMKLDKLIGIISIFDIETGKKKITFKQNKGAISALDFSNDQYLVTADVNNNVKVWDANKGKELNSIPSGQTKILSISANDNYIATGGASGSVMVWDMQSGKNVHVLKGHSSDITSVDISQNGDWLATTDKKSTKVWDLTNGQEVFDNGIENISGGFSNIMNVVKVSNDNTLIASSLFGTVNLYDAKSKNFLKTFAGNDSGLIGNLFFPGTTNPGMLYMGADRVIAKGWDYPNSISKSVKLNVAGKMVQVHPELQSVIAWSPGEDPTIDVYNFDTGKVMCQLKGHTAGVHRAIYSKDGSLIITGSQDNTVRIWNSETGEELNKLSRRGFAATGFNGELFISADNKKLLTRGILNTPTQIWNLESGKSTDLPNVNFVHIPKMSPDGSMIAGTGATMSKKGASTPQLMVFDAETGKKINSFKGNPGSMYLSFSADSKSLALTMSDGVHVVDIASEKLKFKLPHLSVNHFAFSEDNSRILTYGLDGMSRLWNANTGKEIAGFVSFRDNENTIVLPNRYYYSTKGAVGGLHYIMGDKAVPFDQFDMKYNRPDLVFAALDVKDNVLIDAYKKAYQKRLKKSGYSEDMFTEEFHLPEINISNDQIPISTTDRNLSLNFTATDTKYDITKIIVSVNNIPIYGKVGLQVESSKNVAKIIDINLSEGRNKIGISALNAKGIKSIEQVVEIQYTGMEVKPDLYIVAVGVSEFLSKDMNLTYAAKDANDLVNTFQSKSDNYGKITVMKYLNQDATNNNILKSKETLSQSNVDDEVIVFVASHGLLDKNLDYYLATHDVDFYNPSTKGLKYEDLEGLLDGIPARKKLMLLDACHSGEVDKDSKGSGTFENASASATNGAVKFRGFVPTQGQTGSQSLGLQNSFKLMQELFSDLRRGTGAVVISSAGGSEYAFESPEWNNGVFTYSLLEGLKTANCDKDEDNIIVVSELRSYVMSRVVELTNGNQHPTSRTENLEFDFRIW